MAGSQTPMSISPMRADKSIQFSHQIHTVLNQNNYLLWKSQVLPLLRGFDLISFIDGYGSTSSPMISTNGVSVNNPAFAKWYQQDQLILAWLFSSISAPMLAQVLHAETSQQLTQIYTSHFIAKVLELKLLLQTSKKGASTYSQFIQTIQSIVDQLHSVGFTISDQDFVLYTL
jgi:hypothetical protein